MSNPEERSPLPEIIEIIAQRLKVAPVSISPNKSIIDELGADSLDVLQIVADIENRFDVDIPTNAIATVRTPADIADQLRPYLQAKAL